MVPISDDPHRFDAGSVLLHENGRAVTVATSRPHRDRFLVRFEGIGSREEAERLRGALYVSADDARSLSEGEYWPHDLVGCTVETVGGRTVGVVESVVEGPAQDLLVVDTHNGERYVPLVTELVDSIDVGGKRIVIDPPGGLLD